MKRHQHRISQLKVSFRLYKLNYTLESFQKLVKKIEVQKADLKQTYRHQAELKTEIAKQQSESGEKKPVITDRINKKGKKEKVDIVQEVTLLYNRSQEMQANMTEECETILRLLESMQKHDLKEKTLADTEMLGTYEAHY